MPGPTRDGEQDPHESLDDATVAARWAELTAELGELQVPADDGGTRLGRSGPDAAAAASPTPAGEAAPELRAGPSGPAAPVPLPGPRDYSPAEDDEDEGYVPPEPEPLTHADPALTLGWVLAVGSVLLGFVLAVVWRPLPDGVLGGLGAALVGGVALLLWRMPARRDDDRDDGAVV
ncbi:hypothetical protein [Georgenia sp. AZ-5]|uniref:hypothetical protein n=1 Tax=Georgenia sp. AZ-5 TaxID=3367526 RepID=UPI0037540EFF